MLLSSPVVVCDWCGDLFGIRLELEVPLGGFFLTGFLLLLHNLPPYKCHS